MALNIEFNGQSKRVHVTPGTTMFQVVEDARTRFQLVDSACEYQLLHRKRPIDLAIPFRLTGVSNNATLELQAVANSSSNSKGAASSAAPVQVRVCVQLTDGKRVQSAFASDTTIAAILTSFALLPAQHEFALSFLQREIHATAFENTTLKELGITSGSAIFRVQQATASNPLLPPPPAPSVSASASPTVTAPAPLHTVDSSSAPAVAAGLVPSTSTATSSLRAESKQSAPHSASAFVDNGDVEMKDSAPPAAATASNVPPLSSYDALQTLRDSCFDADAVTAITTLLKIVTNVLSNPTNDKMRSIRVANAAFQRSVGRLHGGVAFLEAIGFAFDAATHCLVLPAAASDVDQTTTTQMQTQRLEAGLALLHREADDLRIDAALRPQVVKPQTHDASFDVYKPQIHRMQAQPRGPSATQVLVETLKSKQEALLGQDIPPRNTVVTLPGHVRTQASPASRASDDSNVAMPATADDESHPNDSRIVLSMLKAKRAELEKAQNFRTQAMRELDDLKRKKVFQTTLLRVQFPDRVVLQATFHPSETIQAVLDHVAASLTPAIATNHTFQLYVTPPMQTLRNDKTLAELQLVPAALVYLSWIDAPPPSTHKSTAAASPGFYLRDDVVADEFAESKSSDDASVASVVYPKPIALEPQIAKELSSEDDASSASAAAAPKSAGTKSSGKKPAWLKLSR